MTRQLTPSEMIQRDRAEAQQRTNEALERAQNIPTPFVSGAFVEVLEGGKFVKHPKSWYDALSLDKRLKLRVRRTNEVGNIFQLPSATGTSPIRTKVHRSL